MEERWEGGEAGDSKRRENMLERGWRKRKKINRARKREKRKREREVK